MKNILLTETETAEFLKLSKSMLRKMRGNGTGPAVVKISSSIRYRSDELERFIQERTVTPTRRAA